jgi:hypothetical protein
VTRQWQPHMLEKSSTKRPERPDTQRGQALPSQRPALLGHLKTVEHLEGDSQLKLRNEGLDRRKLLNVSGPLQV